MKTFESPEALPQILSDIAPGIKENPYKFGFGQRIIGVSLGKLGVILPV
jgi:hypothetical protein